MTLSATHYISKHYASAQAEAGEAPGSLSISVSGSGLRYASFSSDYRTLYGLGYSYLDDSLHGATGSFSEHFGYLLNNHFPDSKKYGKVNVTLLNRDFTLLPESYAGEGDIRKHLLFSGGSGVESNVLQGHLKDTVVGFAADPEVYSLLGKKFPWASIRHSATLTPALMLTHHSLRACDLFLQTGPSVIEICACASQQLNYYNVFNFETDEDILYYLLFVMEQLQLDPLTARLALAGEREVNDTLFKSIKKYVKQVSFVSPDPTISIKGEAAPLPGHFYFDVLHAHLCAS